MTNNPPGSRARNDIVLLWFACAIALCAGHYVAFGLLGAAIDAQHQLTGRLSDMQFAQAQTLAQRPALEREGRAIDARLHELDLSADKPTLSARFIHTLTRIAVAHHVNVDAIEERSGAGPLQPASGTPSAVAQRFSIEPIPLDVTLSGGYRALLATIGELAGTPVTMQIDIASIERGAASGGDSAAPETDGTVVLTARLHFILQRLTDDAPLATAPPRLPQDVTTHARSL